VLLYHFVCVAYAFSAELTVSDLTFVQLLRPKWTELYAARRNRRNAASFLPELPDSFFGWIPVVYRITDEEVLESAGLDAYVVCADKNGCDC
jgi:calcium permeable stress-gated cation channel